MWFDGTNNYTTTVLWIVAASFFVYFAKSCYGTWRIFKYLNKFDKPKDCHFIMGDWKILSQPTEILFKTLRILRKEYYPHYILRVLHLPTVNILSPEDCEIIMSSKKNSSKSDIYLLLRSWLREGLLLSQGEKWLKRRKILTPAFHFEILKDFIAIFNEETEKLLDIISTKGSEAIDVFPLCSEFALYSINETAMGIKLDPSNKEQKGYRDAIYDIEDIIVYRLMNPWLYYPVTYIFTPTFFKEWGVLRTLHRFTRNVIRERQRTFKGISHLFGSNEQKDSQETVYKKKKRLAMLDVLLQAHKDGNQIDYKGICEEVDTFMFEGHDTTSAAVSFCLMLIANHPEIQEKLYEEIKSVLGDETTKPNYYDLQKMELLDRCIKESLRLYPSVHFISRCTSHDTVLHSGLMIPKGTVVNIHVYDVHRNPEIYPEPEKFDPDRFLPDACQHRHPFAYIPFSAGPRNCIGQRFAMLEMKALVTGILQRFKLVPVDTPDTIILREEMILRTVDGVKMIFEERN